MKGKWIFFMLLSGMLFVETSCAGRNEIFPQKAVLRQTNSSQETPLPSDTVRVASKKKKKGKEKVKKRAKKTAPDEIVRVKDYIPDIKVDLKYATKNNFTKRKIYDFKEAYLRYGTVKKLERAQKQLRKENLVLLIWDAYRPVRAQYKLWEICPNAKYVANPNRGDSSHSRGNTVDVSLYSTAEEKSLHMPTHFDDFSSKADRNYEDCTKGERENAEKLEKVMQKAGFKGYSGEWWHYSDTVSYPVKNKIN